MAKTRLTGNQAILGGAIIQSTPEIYNASTDMTLGGVRKAGLGEYTLKIPFTGASWSTSVTTNFDTGKDLPAGSIVTDAWFDIHTAGSSGTLAAGTELDPDGFLTGINIQAAAPQIGKTGASITYGALLVSREATTHAYTKVDYVATGAKNVMIGRSATTLTAGTVADLYIEYKLPATS